MAKDKSKKSKAEEPEVEETTSKKAKKDKGEKAPKESKKSAAPIDDSDDDLDPKAPGDGAQIKDLVGKHLLITPTGLKKDFKTSAGISDAIVCDIVVLDLDKPKKSEVFSDSMIFQSVLVSNLKDKVGKGRLAAKLVMGEAKNGKNAPYLFERSDEAKKAARTWIEANGPDLD